MRKRLNKIDPLDIDELFKSPSLEGMLSFRDVDPTTAGIRFKAKTALDANRLTKVTVADDPIAVVPTGATPIGALQHTTNTDDQSCSSPEKPRRDEPADAPGSPIGVAPIGGHNVGIDAALPHALSTSEILAEVHDASRNFKTRGRALRATKVEDAHSNNESSLYWYLWRTGHEIRNSKSHFIQIGYALISKAIGLDRTNVQNILRSLEAKLAIRVVTPGTVKSSTVYEIFSCEQILARRKEGGLLWVRRHGSRRVDFVDEAGNPLVPIGVTPTGPLPRLPLTPPAPIGVAPPEPIGKTPTQLVNSKRVKQTTPTDSEQSLETDIRTVSQAISQYVTPDEDGIQAILRDVRRIVPDALPDEIVHFVHSKGVVVRTGKIQNPMGFFMMAVPNCFKGTTFQQFRQERARQLVQAENQATQAQIEFKAFYEEQKRILNDPNASEEDKTFAYKILTEREKPT